MADVKVGDRVSIDSFKVGQPPRAGTVEDITEGISGTRYLVRWDDGHESFFSPKAGNLIVERRGRKNSGNKGSAKKSSSKAKGSKKAKGKR